ncbi:hypothetical protein [Methylobacterium gnaphalii]|uniref:Uncharacterized protein n=1 Tax=Methylobacterium gnaphalii TaxID=1010610 RepID=A0A512JRS5_9HYPH|nr:hypothetical protein [Methylobacterium gnaphalii]GEP12641.1 hypothetical protein MGN01_44860 [Methylobacterium gnaphalii]GJD71774.1 hypothetical protein MMMDOFMJ_4739 [Methylobacterium gnaphalii]GLS48925.1 hypothetical protein GCM10007885_17720 [Methylobacterium gnaphalii]
MPNLETRVASLLLGVLAPTLALAQNGGNLNGRSEIGSPPEFTYTARSGRSATRGRNIEPRTTGPVRGAKPKSELGGLTTNGICIGCGAK